MPQPNSYTKNEIYFTVAGYKISALQITVEGDKRPGFLMLTGGANIPHREGYYPLLQEALAKVGVNSVCLDFRGVGASEGNVSETTLNTRLEDARAALEILCGTSTELYVAGASMGASIAVRLAAESGVDGIILMVPAAYSEESRDKHFGPAFTESIRKENSWQNSPDFVSFGNFQGKKLLIYAKQDETVPAGVLAAYEAGLGQGEVLAFEGLGHRFMRGATEEDREAREEVYAKIIELITGAGTI